VESHGICLAGKLIFAHFVGVNYSCKCSSGEEVSFVSCILISEICPEKVRGGGNLLHAGSGNPVYFCKCVTSQSGKKYL